MTRNRPFRISVLFRQDRFGSMMLSGFLDMMRYDNCTVESWDIDDKSDVLPMIEVTLRKESGPFTIDRWKSFGINVAELSRG